MTICVIYIVTMYRVFYSQIDRQTDKYQMVELKLRSRFAHSINTSGQ